MGGSFVCVYAHIVFSTKDRLPLLHDAVRPRLWDYMGGILRNHGCVPLRVGGMVDHVHVLLKLSKDHTVPDVVRDLKSNSSRWIRETLEGFAHFGWQQGYAAFSVSVNGLDQVAGYIAHQDAHHAEKSFQDEFRELLDRIGVEYDERYLWR